MSSTTSDIAKVSCFGIVSLVAIMGNIIVCRVLIKHRNVLLKNRPTYQFILSLTFSDLAISALLCPFEVTSEILGSWPFGTVVCKIFEILEVSTSGSAVITHALIAVDRYRSLAHPYLPRLKAKLVKLLIALSWFFPAFISSPHLYMAQVVNVKSTWICTLLAIPVPWLDKIYEAAEFVVMFLSPLCVICWCYFHVVSLTRGSVGEAQIPTTEIALRRSQKRVTKTSCLILVAFVICWSPRFVLSIWRIASGTESVHRGHLVYEIALFGELINEAINPIIYTASDRNMNVWEDIQCSPCVSNKGNNENELSSRANERHRRSCRNATMQFRFVESHV